MLLPDNRILGVRWYVDADLYAMVELHNDCLPHERWTLSDFIAFANKSGARTNVIKVLTAGEEIVGTLLYSLVRNEDECQVRRVCIRRDMRRRGYGSYLVRKLIGVNSQTRKQNFTARVDERCWEAVHFFGDSELGFVADPRSTVAQVDSHASVNRTYGFRHFRPAPARRVLVGA